MTVEQRIKKLSDLLKTQIRNCPDPSLIGELVKRRRVVLQLGKKVTGENIDRKTSDYVAFADQLSLAVKELDQEGGEIEDIAKWIERGGKAVAKVCELAAKVV